MRLQLERSGGTIDLGSLPLARGGEAAIYAVPSSQAGGRTLVAKIYHQPDAVKARKLTAMLDHQLAAEENGHHWLAWPLERLLKIGAKRACVGYVMPMVNGARPIHECYNPGLRRKYTPHFNYKYLLRTAKNLAGIVHRIHRHGYVIGDLNEGNILATPTAMITLVDCDSWQFSGHGEVFRCRVGRPEYTPPEIQGLSYGQSDRRAEQDLFGLAVMVWRLLMCGTHPFDGKFVAHGDPPSVAQRIRSGLFPYAPNGRRLVVPSALAPPLRTLDNGIRNLMLRCFVDGHQNPKLRPDGETWFHIIRAAESRLRICRRNPQHVFDAGLGVCPWCKLTERSGCDPFRAQPICRTAGRSVSCR